MTGGMEITILGSGTAVPVPDRFPAGALVRGGGETLLVDCGPGTLRRLAQAGGDIKDITTVLLTHFHTDHTGDLAALLFALRNPAYRGRPPLRIVAAEGLVDLIRHLTAAWPWLAPAGAYDLVLEEIGPGAVALNGLEGTAVRIEHTDRSLGYRIADDEGRAVAFSGDADVCPGLVEVARGAELFVCDCSFPDALRTPGHLTPGLAGRAAREAGVGTLCLTHFYPECDGHDLEAQARAEFSGRIVLAEDLMRLRPARA